MLVSMSFSLQATGSDLLDIERSCILVFNQIWQKEAMPPNQHMQKLLLNLYGTCIYSDEEFIIGPSLMLAKDILEIKEDVNKQYI